MSATSENPVDTAVLGSSQLREIVSSGTYGRVIWDFDGVIADSEPLHSEAYKLILERCGIHPQADFFRDYIGQTEFQIWSALRERYKIERDLDALRQERIAVYLERATRELRPSWFVRPLMNWFSQKNSAQCIVSSGNKPVVDALLDEWQLRPYVLEVFAAEPETVASYSKLNVLRSVISSAQGRVIAFEDHERYLIEASALGATTVGVRHSLNDLPDGIADFVLQGGQG